MLSLIKHFIGGKVKFVEKEKFVIWVINDKKQIHVLLKAEIEDRCG